MPRVTEFASRHVGAAPAVSPDESSTGAIRHTEPLIVPAVASHGSVRTEAMVRRKVKVFVYCVSLSLCLYPT